jgi:iron complex outermembrane receptor protein
MRYLILLVLWSSFSSSADDLSQIEVTADETPYDIPFSTQSLKIQGSELTKKRESSVGEMLKSEVGVQSTAFGPNASRPVIRGLDGDRVKILQNGLSSLDASTQSLDHAVPVNTMLLEQVEIVRGPMTLLYGSSAVGGVVNFSQSRIHRELVPGVLSTLGTSFETAHPGPSSYGKIDYGVGRWMLHVDGSTRNLADQKIPSHLKGGVDNKKGELPNSFNQQDDFSFGATHFLSSGFFGLSYNNFFTQYGSVADEEVSIAMNQERTEFHWDWVPTEDSVLEKVSVRALWSDYLHEEIEGGEVGTTFENEGSDVRVEFHTKSGKSKGVWGVQSQLNHFEAVGEEAFLPGTDNKKLAGFIFKETALNSNQMISFGSRLEQVLIEKQQSFKFGSSDRKDYLSVNASLGHRYDFAKESSFFSTLAYSERAPNAQELFAFGDHLATGSFEQGDSSLKKEKAYSLEFSYQKKNSKGDFFANIYTQIFKDFILLSPTGESNLSPEGLPEYLYDRTDAYFYGAEAKYLYYLAALNQGQLNLLTKADYVRGKDSDSGENLPRISPGRLSFSFEYLKDLWSSDLEFQYGFHQTKTSPQEKGTSDYSQVNLGIYYQWLRNDQSLKLFGKIRNIFDAEIRNHVSLLKEIAPAPGRNFVMGLETHF